MSVEWFLAPRSNDISYVAKLPELSESSKRASFMTEANVKQIEQQIVTSYSVVKEEPRKNMPFAKKVYKPSEELRWVVSDDTKQWSGRPCGTSSELGADGWFIAKRVKSSNSIQLTPVKGR